MIRRQRKITIRLTDEEEQTYLPLVLSNYRGKWSRFIRNAMACWFVNVMQDQRAKEVPANVGQTSAPGSNGKANKARPAKSDNTPTKRRTRRRK